MMRLKTSFRRIIANARERRGFALPLAILVIAALTATLAAAFSSVTAEIATNSAQRSESRAFALAESGLEEYFARRTYLCTARAGYTPSCGSPPTVNAESVTVSLQGGYAEVVAQRVRRAVGTTLGAIYLVRSRGVDTVAPFNGATRAVYGERIIAQYAVWNSKSIQVRSGWTSLTGLNKNGNSGSLTGIDNCSSAAGGGAPAIPGVSVPTVPGYTGPDRTSGSPTGIETLGTQTAANDAVKIDWNGIVNGGAVTADYAFNVGSAAPAALVSAWADPTQYPVVHVTGNGTFTIPNGQGLLIIDGNATMSGATTWNGIIMAGGNMTSNGNTTVNGAIITGLNMKLTLPQLTAAGFLTYPSNGDTGNGTKNMSYDSCQVQKAASRFGTFKVIPNAWMDNYTTY